MSQPSLPTPPVTLRQICDALPDAVLVGDGSVTLRQLVHPREVRSPEDLVLVVEAAALAVLQPGTPVQAAIVADGIPVPDGVLKGYIRVKRPRVALVSLLKIFDKPLHAEPGVHPTAVVAASAKVDPSVSVGALAYVGEDAVVGANTVIMPQVTVGAQARLGENCILHSGARIGERVIVGNRVIIQHNASIGADGFSYVTPEPGSIESAKASGGKVEAQNTEILRINSIGTVVLEDDVEIGACATVDRANLGATLVKKGTKIDNLVMIGHNNSIGENCLIVAQVGVAGSCQIGDRVVLAGQAGIGDHLKVGHDSIIMAQAGVLSDVAPKSVLLGSPAQPRREELQKFVYQNRLKEAFQELKALRKRMEELEAELGQEKAVSR